VIGINKETDEASLFRGKSPREYANFSDRNSFTILHEAAADLIRRETSGGSGCLASPESGDIAAWRKFINYRRCAFR